MNATSRTSLAAVKRFCLKTLDIAEILKTSESGH
jgi:hypothetical protein